MSDALADHLREVLDALEEDRRAFEVALAALKRVKPQTTGVLVVQDIEYAIRKIEERLRGRER